MHKLIIGCGYLGRRVAARWLAAGHVVHALTRNRGEELGALGIRPFVGDVRASLDLPHAATVLYAVAPGRQTGQTPADVWQTGLANVTRVLREWTAPTRFLFISSASVYGQTGGEEVDETAATEPREEAGRVLLDAEKSLLQDWWPEAIVLRFGGIYGLGRLLRSKAIVAGEAIVGDADKWLNLIHVDDGAAAILAAEARARPGAVYNICDGRPVRRREFYAALARFLGAPVPRFVPPPPDSSLPPHETANRRLSNRRLRDELKVDLRYPSYAEGLAACQEFPDRM
jgi:nucleoside-diphosphate-sugar epimerase